MVFNTYISSNRRQQFTTVTYETLQNVKNLEPSWKGFAAKNKTREDRSNNGQRTTYGTRSETAVCLVTTKQNESRTHEVLTMGRSANSNNVLERRAMTNVLVKWRRTHVIRLGDGTGTADRRWAVWSNVNIYVAQPDCRWRTTLIISRYQQLVERMYRVCRSQGATIKRGTAMVTRCSTRTFVCGDVLLLTLRRAIVITVIKGVRWLPKSRCRRPPVGRARVRVAAAKTLTCAVVPVCMRWVGTDGSCSVRQHWSRGHQSQPSPSYTGRRPTVVPLYAHMDSHRWRMESKNK
jgi:hypothetical protein